MKSPLLLTALASVQGQRALVRDEIEARKPTGHEHADLLAIDLRLFHVEQSLNDIATELQEIGQCYN
jgi:hypothetical protein